MSTVHETEVAIVGAGVSGLALALDLGRRGHDVLLIDRAPAPRDKACGEGIMPPGLRYLAALGIEARTLPGVDFDGLDYLAVRPARSGRPAGMLRHPLRFPSGVTGRGVRRTRLLDRLEQAARACAGVRIAQDDVRGVEWNPGSPRRVVALAGADATYRAAVFVAADGVNSRMAQWCGARPWRYGERYAARRHYRLPPGRMPPRVQVGLLGSHDLYLTPVSADELLATTLTDRAGYRAALEAAGGYDGFLRAGPYGRLFADAEPVSECLSWYHPLFHARRYVAGGVLLVGDAGGGIDPCLGMGMSHALLTSVAAGEAIAGRLSGAAAGAGHRAVDRGRTPDIHERAFVRARRRLFLHTHHFGRVFSALVGSSRGARVLMWTMGRMPRMADRVLAVVADFRPWRSLAASSPLGEDPPTTDVVGVTRRRAAEPAGGETVSPVQHP